MHGIYYIGLQNELSSRIATLTMNTVHIVKVQKGRPNGGNKLLSLVIEIKMGFNYIRLIEMFKLCRLFVSACLCLEARSIEIQPIIFDGLSSVSQRFSVLHFFSSRIAIVTLAGLFSVRRYARTYANNG